MRYFLLLALMLGPRNLVHGSTSRAIVEQAAVNDTIVIRDNYLRVLSVVTTIVLADAWWPGSIRKDAITLLFSLSEVSGNENFSPTHPTQACCLYFLLQK